MIARVLACAALATVLLALPAHADDQGWAPTIRAPRPLPAGDSLYQDCTPDAGLSGVAHQLLRARLRGDSWSQRELQLRLRRAGLPYVWPRAWVLAGDSDAQPRFRQWLKHAPARGISRCGIARGADVAGRPFVAAVAVDALAEMAPLPLRVRASDWVSLDATTNRSYDSATVALLGPTGKPKRVLASLSGRQIRSRFRLDQPGRWLVQLLADGPRGPEPVLEAWVFSDVEPSAPRERQMMAVPQDADGAYRLLSDARRQEGVPPLRRDAALEALARQHAVAMKRAGTVAHDVGSGGPYQRAEAAGIAVTHLGENVANAPTIERTHAALWDSPTHRENMLDGGYTRVGIAAVRGDRGFWVTQVFAR